jgi:hypothetical protein
MGKFAFVFPNRKTGLASCVAALSRDAAAGERDSGLRLLHAAAGKNAAVNELRCLLRRKVSALRGPSADSPRYSCQL